MTQIIAQEVKLNGRRRWHFVGPTGKSLRTWASKRSALGAGKREFRWAK
jgi:hypothetical protein